MLISLSTGSSIEDDSFLAIKPFGFSKFLIITLSPNFFFKIWSAFPIPSINPRSRDVLPVQNSPVKILFFSGSLSFFPLLFSTTFIKSSCSSSWIVFNLLIISLSSLKGSKVLFIFTCSINSSFYPNFLNKIFEAKRG